MIDKTIFTLARSAKLLRPQLRAGSLPLAVQLQLAQSHSA
jgi:hypothetical protein